MDDAQDYSDSGSVASDSDDIEVDYSTLYNEEDIDEEYNSNDESEDDDILPENNHTKFNIISNNELYVNFSNEKKLHPYLTKFEKVKILSLRASQIENGSPVLVTVPSTYTDSKHIAELEFREKKIPFIIRRYINNGYEDWKLSDFLNY